MAIFLPQRWRSQLPTPDAGVDWSNPLTLGLRNLWNMAGRGVRDATGAANGTPIGGGGLLATTDGLGANFDSSGTTYIDLARPNQFNLASGSRWSMMFRVRTTTDTAQALFHYGDGTANNRFALFVGNGVSAALTDELITFVRVIGASQAPLAGYTTATRTQLVDGAIHSVMLTSNGSTIAIYLDGLSRTVTIGAGVQNGLINLSGATATTATLGAQNTGTIGAKFNGQMTVAAFWAADVSRYALELHRNPWQLFRPANSPVFYSLPSGGTTITTVVGDATAAGQQAGISVNITVAANTGNATADGLQASISVSTVIAAGTGNAVADGAQASVAANTTIAAGTGNAVADGLQADVISSGDVPTNVGNAVANGLQATILSAETIVANVGNAVADGLQATITQADELPLIVGGFWEEQWRRIRERERKRQEPPQALIERVEEQIAEVAQVLEVPRPATVNVERVLVDLQLRAQQLELAADRVRVVQRLIAEAQALQAEIEEEEDLLMLL